MTFANRLAALLTLFLAPVCANAQATNPAPSPSPSPNFYDSKWHGTVTPYLWAPSINGTLVFHHPVLATVLGALGKDAQIDVSTGPENYLSFLNSAFAAAGGIRKNAFDLNADLIFLNLSHTGTNDVTITGPNGNIEIPVTSSIGWHLNETLWELDPGIILRSSDVGDVELFGGVRSLSVRAAANWTFTGPLTLVPLTGQDSASVNLTDFVAGVRGKINLSDRWFVPFYADAGSGNNNTTGQYYGGVGYAMRWGSLELFYRQLNYFQSGSDARLRDIQLSGLALGATFKL